AISSARCPKSSFGRVLACLLILSSVSIQITSTSGALGKRARSKIISRRRCRFTRSRTVATSGTGAVLGSTLRARRLVAGDQACRAVSSHVIREPLEQHHQAVRETDEVQDVDEQPSQPGDESSELKYANFGNGGIAADRRHASLVPIDERADVRF